MSCTSDANLLPSPVLSSILGMRVIHLKWFKILLLSCSLKAKMVEPAGESWAGRWLASVGNKLISCHKLNDLILPFPVT